MPDLAARVRGALLDTLLTVEDEMGPTVDLSTAQSIAQDVWLRFVDSDLMAALAVRHADGYRSVNPGGLRDDSFAAFWAARRRVLASLPARLLASVRTDVSAAAGDGLPLLAAARERLDDLADDGPWRADRIARTEQTAAANAGTFDGLLADDPDNRVVWVTEHDERVRSLHADLDNQVRTVGQEFAPGLRFPGDPSAPPEQTVNCRCRLSPVSLTAAAPEDQMSKPTLPNALTADAVDTTPGTEPVYSALPDGWTGCLAPLGVMSGDNRLIARSGDAPRSRPLPMEMGWQKSNEPGHDGAVTAARIDRVWYDNHDGRDCLHGEGAFDLGSADGAELSRRVADGFAGQVSVDLVDTTVEFALVLPDGSEAAEPTSMEEYLDLMASGVKEVMRCTDWELGSTTFVSIPAFREARVQPVYGYTPSVPSGEAEVEAALLASVRGEHVYAAEDFEVKEPGEVTPLTITDDGRVYGHLAAWGTCHVGFANVCQEPPSSKAGYAYFHVGSVATTKGEVPVGKITVGGGHADAKAGVIPTLAHYDDAGTTVAVVRAVDGAHGVWVSGHLLPDARPADVAALRRSPLSGDWRRVRGNLELVAALAVNVPGFPVPRALAASIGSEQVSLVAAGVVPPPAALAESSHGAQVSASTFAREVLAEMKRQQAADLAAERLAKRMGLDPDSRVAALAERIGLS